MYKVFGLISMSQPQTKASWFLPSQNPSQITPAIKHHCDPLFRWITSWLLLRGISVHIWISFNIISFSIHLFQLCLHSQEHWMVIFVCLFLSSIKELNICLSRICPDDLEIALRCQELQFMITQPEPALGFVLSHIRSRWCISDFWTKGRRVYRSNHQFW